MKRLGNGLTVEQYQVERSNDTWPDHRLRTLTTAGMIAWMEPDSVLDPACGDGSIVLAANDMHPINDVYLYDISKPSIDALRHRTAIGIIGVADAFDIINEVTTDLVVLTEFLEHIEDPKSLLRLARKSHRGLIASSPINETGSGNHEHVWSWTKESYKSMLEECGWIPIAYQQLDFYPPAYSFQIWACK